LSPLANRTIDRATLICDGAWARWGQVMEDSEIQRRLELMRVEHRDLDAAIDAMRLAGAPDQLQIARLKKRKLRLRDEIAVLEDQLIPDIIA
jgi:hypothetical protein